MKEKQRTNFVVHVFLDGKEIKPSSLNKLTISNDTVDRIINDVVTRTSFDNEEVTETVS